MSSENRNDNGGTGSEGSADTNPFLVDPGTIRPAVSATAAPGIAQPETAKRKPGRPKGSKNSRAVNTTDPVPLPVDAISGTLFSIHAFLSGMTKVPELAIDEMEAKKMAEASAKVAAHYSVVANPKTVDWCNLVAVLGMVYGTRFFAIKARMTREAKEKAAARKPKPNPDGTIPFPGGVLPPMDRGPGSGGPVN